MIVLRQVSKYVFDVFSGKGWPIEDAAPGASDAAWTRVRQNTWGIQPLMGARITKHDCKVLEGVIARYPHGNVNAIEA